MLKPGKGVLRRIAVLVLSTLACALTPSLQAQLLPAPPSVSTVRIGCAWKEGMDENTQDTGYRDSAARYYTAMLPVDPADGSYYEISGSFAQSRYFSFQSYDGARIGNFINSLPDALIHPQGLEAGLLPANPAVLPDSGNYLYRYTIKAVYADPPAPESRAPNTVYLRRGTQKGAVVKQLGYRIYLPNPGISRPATGGTDLPTITYVGPQGRIDLRQTPDQAICDGAPGSDGTPGASSGSINPKFKALGGPGYFIVYPNGDAYYLQADIRNDYADMIVVRGKAPLTPVLPPLQQPAHPQVRYWSACSYDLKTSNIAGCTADRDAITRDGDFIFVLSTAEKRPLSANPAYGVNWLPWGPSTDSRFGLRQILPDPGFPGNYNRAIAAPLRPLAETLGEWAPELSFCDRATFEATVAQGGQVLMAACKAAYPQPLPAV